MSALVKFLRRAWLTRRLRSAKAEIADIEAERDRSECRLAWLLQHEMALRAHLVWLDIGRPPVSRAIGTQRLDGVVRPIGTTGVSVTQIAPRRRASK